MAEEVASQVLAQLQELGWSKAQATGITANIQAESGFNHTAVGDGGKAYGIAQWHPNRQADFEAQYGKSIKDSSLAEQVSFIDHELRAGKEQSAGRRLAAVDDPGEAASVVSRYYERPADHHGEAAKRATLAHSMAGTTMATQTQAAAQTAIQSAEAGASALSAFQNQHQAFIDSMTATMEGSKEDVALVKQTEELGKAKAQQSTLDFATKIGSNPDASTEALSKLVERSNQLFEQQRTVAARLENAGNPSTMFDSPVRWLADYLLVPYNKQRLGAVTDQLKSTTDQIKWINSTTQDTRQTMDAIAITKTTETAAASARNAKALIDIEAAKQQAEAVRFNSQNLTQTVAMQNNVFSIRSRVRDQELQEAQIEESRASRKMQAEALRLSLSDKTNVEAGQNSYLEAVNLGAQNTGTPQFKTFQELEIFRKLNPRADEILAVNWTNGRAQLEGTPPTIASTPYAALTFKAASGANLDPARAKLIGKIQGTYDRELRQPERSGSTAYKDIRNSKTAAGAVNTLIGKRAAADAADIMSGGEANLYAPPPLASIQQDPEFSKTYLSTHILKALAESGSETIPFDKAIPLLLKDVTAGKVSVAEADSDLNFLAHKIVGMNNDMYRYNATAGVPNMKSVNVTVHVPDEPGIMWAISSALTVSGPPTQMLYVDLLDPVSRSTMFNKAQAAQLKIAPQTSKVN